MTRNRIIILAGLITSSIVVYVDQNFITLLIFYTISTLIIFSLFHLLRARKNLHISQKIYPVNISHGDKTEYTFKIFNKSFFPYQKVEVKFMYSNNIFLDQLTDFEVALYPTERFLYKYDIEGKYRGKYLLGAFKVEVYDILNIFKINLKIKDIQEMTVYPKVTEIADFRLNANYSLSEFLYDTTSSLHEDSIKDIREYQQGDPLKNIHWKLFSKYDKLMVKEKENSSINKSILFIDTEDMKGDFEANIIYQDKLLEAYLSVLKKLINEKHLIEVCYYDEEMKTFKNDINFNFDYFFDQIINLDFMNGVMIANTIDDYFSGFYQNQNIQGIDIIVFTLNPERNRLMDILKNLIASSANVHVISANSKISKSNYITEEGIRIYNIDPTTDINGLHLSNVVGGYYENI